MTMQRVDTTAAWGTCSLQAFAVEILVIRCTPIVPAGTITVSILDARGQAVRVSELAAEGQVWLWDGKDSMGRKVDDGAYRVRFSSRRGALEIRCCKRPVAWPGPPSGRSIDSPIGPPSAPTIG
jgi:hypothetical protein